MKRSLLFLAATAIMASCSSPKYTYNFDHYNYNSGKKKNSHEFIANESTTKTNETLIASIDNASTLVSSEVAVPVAVALGKETIKNTFKNISKEDRQRLKKEIRKEVKEYVKTVKKNDVESINGTQAMDSDLKMAAIFGSIGLVLGLLGPVSSVFWILSAVAWIVGIVFFVKWLLRQ